MSFLVIDIGNTRLKWGLYDAAYPGATLLAGAEGFGHDDRMHASHFFELADEPQIVSMALPADRAETLLQRIGQEGLHVFYTRAAIAWAMT